MTSTRLYPGMCDDSLEIFFHSEEKELKAIYSGQVIPFADVPAERKIFLREIIEQETETQQALQEMCGSDPAKQLEQLAACRFGGLNFQPDYTTSEGVAHADYVECPLRGSCVGCGIVCRDMEYNGEALGATDIDAIRLMASDHKTELLAEELNMPLGSFHVYRTNLFRRIGVKSKPELARVGVELGLI